MESTSITRDTLLSSSLGGIIRGFAVSVVLGVSVAVSVPVFVVVVVVFSVVVVVSVSVVVVVVVGFSASTMNDFDEYLLFVA